MVLERPWRRKDLSLIQWHQTPQSAHAMPHCGTHLLVFQPQPKVPCQHARTRKGFPACNALPTGLGPPAPQGRACWSWLEVPCYQLLFSSYGPALCRALSELLCHPVGCSHTSSTEVWTPKLGWRPFRSLFFPWVLSALGYSLEFSFIPS